MMRVVWLILISSTVAKSADRVAQARQNVAAKVAQAFKEAGVAYPPQELYLRAFKAERVLEVWAGKKGQPLTHIKAFPICAASGQPGPKRARGDSQVPEGLYEISLFNPLSNFHLSLKVSYPNAADRILGTEPDLGGDIFIHGSCASVGCLAIEDGPIEELYVMAQDTVRKPIAIHIFPTRVGGEVAEHAALWHQLEEAQKLFDRTHRPPNALVDKKTGAYLFPMALPKMRQ